MDIRKQFNGFWISSFNKNFRKKKIIEINNVNYPYKSGKNDVIKIDIVEGKVSFFANQKPS